MRLELAERLVCPSAHERTPLIVVAHETAERELLRGDVGCMRCQREGRIAEGSLYLGAPPALRTDGAPVVSSDGDTLERLTALLALNEPGLPLLLGASFAAAAPQLVAQHDAVVAVLGAAGASPAGVGYVTGSGDAVPFADGTFHAAALDARFSAAAAEDAVRCVRVGGRVLGPVSLALPSRVRELARDAQQWVGEVAVAAVVVPLRRA